MQHRLTHRNSYTPRLVDPSGFGDEEMPTEEVARIAWEEADENSDSASKLNEFLRLYPKDSGALSRLLRFLFPAVLGDSPVSEEGKSVASRRVAVHANLLKLLYHGVLGDLFSSRDAESFLADEVQRDGLLVDAVESQSLPGWLAHVQEFVSSARISSPATLISQIVLSVNTLYRGSGIDATMEARDLLIGVLKRMAPEERSTVLRQLLSDRDTVAVGEPVLSYLRQKVGSLASGPFHGESSVSQAEPELEWLPSPDELERLCDAWVSAIRGIGVRQIILDYPNTIRVLLIWGQLSELSYDEVKEALDHGLADTDIAIAFLNHFQAGIRLNGIERLLSRKSILALKQRTNDDAVLALARIKFNEHFANIFDPDGPEGEEHRTGNA